MIWGIVVEVLHDKKGLLGSSPGVSSIGPNQYSRVWQGLQTGSDLELLEPWARLIFIYSFPQEVDNPADRPVAILGLTEDVSRIRGNNNYFSRIWTYSFRNDCVWHSV